MLERTEVKDVSLGDISSRLRQAFHFLVKRWWKLSLAVCIGAGLGAGYALYKPAFYTARLSFFIEEGKAGGMGLSSLAGQFGFDLGSLTGGSNGLMSGDNVSFFLKSASLTRQILLTPYDSTRNYSLADRYAEVYKLRAKWKDNKKIGADVFFPVTTNKPFTRLQDSLLQVIEDKMLKNEIAVSKPDRKASFIEVTATTRDEMFSKFYCERLVNAALDRYIKVKTDRQAKNVNRLQLRADSIAVLLNRKTYSSASAQEKLLDLNPAFQSVTATTEVLGRDKMMLATIYGEVIKNLEIAKMALSQETPVIQVIDSVDLPLKKEYLKPSIAAIVGGFVLGLLATAYFLLHFLLVGEKMPRKQKRRLRISEEVNA